MKYMAERKHDFAGWVTKNDIRCSDGVVIKHGAFKGNDNKKVPLVWNHNHGVPGNILGHVMLHNRDEGVYGYGYLNESEEAKHAKELINHGDISAMSIGANRLKKRGSDVIHGMIYEVSLVLAGANPGALIEAVMTHSDDGDEIESDKAVIYTDTLIHSADEEEELEHEEKGGNEVADKTVGEVMDTMNEEQKQAVQVLLASVLEDEDGDIEQGEDLDQNTYEGGEIMKHNVFNGQVTPEGGEVLEHSELVAIFDDAKKSTLKEAMLQHGITGIETLFPEAHNLNKTPHILKQENTAGKKIVDGTRKSPFSKVKNLFADLTEDEARAKGYIKGNEKLEQVFSLLTRETSPQTVYKKQKLDRDDVIDITDFDVVNFINAEMKVMLIEEIGRAVLVGDGRDVSSPDKIKSDKIRPIVTDDDLYTIKKTAVDAADVIEVVIKAMADYQGSGAPTMFMSPTMLANLRLLKDSQGRFLFGDIPSASAIAARLGVASIEPTTFLTDQIVIVNLNDYTLGATKGGEITNFDDFDIDFNQYKYLIETRLSGALTKPYSAITVTVGTPPAE